jgi:hypothetical protein
MSVETTTFLDTLLLEESNASHLFRFSSRAAFWPNGGRGHGRVNDPLSGVTFRLLNRALHAEPLEPLGGAS